MVVTILFYPTLNRTQVLNCFLTTCITQAAGKIEKIQWYQYNRKGKCKGSEKIELVSLMIIEGRGGLIFG